MIVEQIIYILYIILDQATRKKLYDVPFLSSTHEFSMLCFRVLIFFFLFVDLGSSNQK